MKKIVFYLLKYPLRIYLFFKKKIIFIKNYLSNYLVFNIFFSIIKFVLFRLQNFLKINIFFNVPPHHFPITSKGIAGLDEPLKVNKNETYYTRAYNEQLIVSHNENKKNSLSKLFFLDEYRPKVEMLNCNKIKNKTFTFLSKNDCVLPVSACDNDIKFKINLDGKKYEIEVPFYRFYYLRLKKNQKIIIENTKNFLVGVPINLSQESKNHTKISLGIFVDGFAALEACKVINSLEEIMPHTYNFFKKGTHFKNHHTNSHWSLPSMAEIFTGCNIQKHELYHHRKQHVISENINLLSEIFKKKNYLCSHFGGNTRANPNYGYLRGFDRYVFKRNYTCDEVISSYLEHLRAFKDRDHFTLLSLTDLHHFHNTIPDIATQVAQFPEYLNILKKDRIKKKSIHESYDAERIKIYLEELRKLDHDLNVLYEFLEKNFTNDEYIISIFSDHGRTFLSKSKDVLSFERRRVEWFIRGRNIPSKECFEFTENIDIFDTILKKSGINNYNQNNLDGHMPNFIGGEKKKDYVITQNIYPYTSYKAVITDKNYQFEFESKCPINDIEEVSPDVFTYTLINLKTTLAENNEQIILKYRNICMEKVTQLQKKPFKKIFPFLRL